MQKVSVIIPAYNVENYIFRTIESVLNQTYPFVEAIIVDDGSSDKTWEVITNYKEKDDRVIAIKQDNQGVSSARNVGLDNASGDYCVFLDSDDWLEENAIEYLINIQDKYPSYFICSSPAYVDINNNNLIRVPQEKPLPNEVIDKQEAVSSIGTNFDYYLRSSCYKLYKLDIINNLRFNTNIFHGEDGLFVYEYLIKTDGIVFSTEALWNILNRSDSATNSSYNKKWLSAIDAAKIMFDSAKEIFKDNPIIEKNMTKYLINRIEIVEKEICLSDEKHYDDYVNVRNILRSYKDNFYNSNPSFKERIKYNIFIKLSYSNIKKIYIFLNYHKRLK